MPHLCRPSSPSGFRDGLPLHLHQSARSKKYSPEASSIFVVNFKDFQMMTAKEIQDIFHHCHILIHNSPIKASEFNLEVLEILGLLTAKVSMQGQFQVDLRGSDIHLT
jgi:hypothetical protein